MLKVVDEVIVYLTKNKEVIQLKLIIAKGYFKLFLGRDWLSILVPNWKEILRGCKSVAEVYLLNDVEKVDQLAKEISWVF